MDRLNCKWIMYTIFFILMICGLPVFGGEYCYMYYYGYYNLYLGYCSNDCCGSYAYYRYCCNSYYYYTYTYTYSYWSVGTIVGAVIGGLIGLAVAVVVLIIICKECNKRTTRGAIIAPQAQAQQSTTTQFVYSTGTQQYVPPNQQPAYPAPNPVFPPGQPGY